ncbi:MAG: flagellar hook assembly protein FlgD [Salinarimonas sp.]|nr:flagellar hook assembly protein FlgD [Salinarimonas sp.]
MAAGIENIMAGQGGAQQADTARKGIADNFDAFLLLLTTQLQNQSPLDPLDTNEFTQQLVQFASVEQQIKSNEVLESLLKTSRAQNVATAASFVGMKVRADGKESQLADGKAEWTLDVPVNAARTTIEIRDEKGNTVATRSGALSAGRQVFTWDGMTSSGQFAEPGRYSININAQDSSGQPISVKTEVEGVVDALDLEGQEPVLLIGKQRVPLSQIKGAMR